jgi:hypothetical protein
VIAEPPNMIAEFPRVIADTPGVIAGAPDMIASRFWMIPMSTQFQCQFFHFLFG